MALLSNPRQTPPSGFRYVQPQTQTLIEHETLQELVGAVCEHRRYKGLSPTDPESVCVEIQRQICASMPPGVCGPEPGENYKPTNDLSRSLTLDKITSFSFAVFEWIRSGRNFVDEEEATRRAKICLGCPLNKTIHACACAPLWTFLRTIIPPKRAIDNLHICSACGCALQAKVLMPLNVIRESNAGREITFPPYCWQLTAM